METTEQDNLDKLVEKYGIHNIISTIKRKAYKIHSFEDACEKIDLNPKNLPDVSNILIKYHKFMIAHYKLAIIAEALNEGWEPNYNDAAEQKWCPWFNYITDSGFICADAYDGYESTASGVGSRFCFKTKELAEYAGRNFISLYNDYLKM